MFTMGSDPELFLIDDRGRPVSAIGRIGGTKKKPVPLGIGYIQEDNVLLEFNTPPASTREEWVDNHLIMMEQVKALAKSQGLSTKLTPAMKFPVDYLKATPEALEFGCEPAYSAMENGSMIDAPSPYTPWRTAGGHIHVGDEKYKNRDYAVKAVKTLATVMEPYLKMGASIDAHAVRMGGYGQVGAMRWKPYGFEWRAPSNAWLRSANSIGFMWDAVTYILDKMDDLDSLQMDYRGHGELMHSMINYINNNLGGSRFYDNSRYV